MELKSKHNIRIGTDDIMCMIAKSNVNHVINDKTLLAKLAIATS